MHGEHSFFGARFVVPGEPKRSKILVVMLPQLRARLGSGSVASQTNKSPEHAVGNRANRM